jgi:xylulokinase
VQSVLEGVALALADCHDALLDSGATIGAVTLTGGGARNDLWARLIAAALGCPLEMQADAQSGPALGAARLARQGVGGPLIAAGGSRRAVAPEAALREALLAKRAPFRKHLGLR